jgi:hypothetical protein
MASVRIEGNGPAFLGQRRLALDQFVALFFEPR